MGHYVHLHVAFACDRNEGVAALAKGHLDMLPPKDSDDGWKSREARWFLEALSERTGSNPGPKGGVSLWGVIGNYTQGEDFVEVLKPFWRALLGEVEGGPHDFEHVIVFEEQEQSEQAVAYEISLGGDRDSPNRDICIRRHELPFAWMQF